MKKLFTLILASALFVACNTEEAACHVEEAVTIEAPCHVEAVEAQLDAVALEIVSIIEEDSLVVE